MEAKKHSSVRVKLDRERSVQLVDAHLQAVVDQGQRLTFDTQGYPLPTGRKHRSLEVLVCEWFDLIIEIYIILFYSKEIFHFVKILKVPYMFLFDGYYFNLLLSPILLIFFIKVLIIIKFSFSKVSFGN